jgi:ubiquinone/menaquinone biosynthesis C-methylase UbiE
MKRAYFEDLAPRWDSLPGPPDAAQRARRFASAALTSRETAVLDAGCGTGILGEAVLAACPNLRLLIECDFAHAMLLENRRKLAAPTVAQLCGDLAAPPLPSRSLDAVLCLNVLPHLEDLDASLPALLRLLRAGGRFAVGHFMSSPRLNELHRSIGGPVAGDTLPASRELASRLERLGCRVLRADEEEDHYLVLAEAQ